MAIRCPPAKFTHRAEASADLPPLKARGLLLCSEELSGHLPGRGGLPVTAPRRR
ncbi:MAG: hypothetical protein R3D85_15765 [Paracoccaceae bacterium]